MVYTVYTYSVWTLWKVTRMLVLVSLSARATFQVARRQINMVISEGTNKDLRYFKHVFNSMCIYIYIDVCVCFSRNWTEDSLSFLGWAGNILTNNMFLHPSFGASPKFASPKRGVRRVSPRIDPRSSCTGDHFPRGHPK